MTARWRWRPLAQAKAWLLAGFLLAALPVGLLAASLTPPGQVQDEATQLARAAGLLHGAVFADRRFAYDPWLHDFAWEAGVSAPVQIIGVVTGPSSHAPDGHPVMHAADMAAIAALARPRRLHLGFRFFYYIPNTASYFPASYIPAALGLLAGAGLRQGALAALLCARLADLATYLALGAAALAIAGFGEPLLLAVLVLPFSLFLAGSVNQDGLLIALAVFGVAGQTRPEARWRYLGLAALTVLAAAKPPYLPLLGLAALPGPGWRRRASAVGAVMLLVAGIAAYNGATATVPFDYVVPGTATGAFYHPGPLYTGDPRAWFDTSSAPDNMAALLAHPLSLLSVPWRTLASVGPDWPQLIGKFGNNPPPLAHWFVWLWVAALAAALLGCGAGRGRLRATGAVALLLTAASLWLVILGLYISDTHVGALAAEGFRPRYLLPLLPVLALGRPARRPMRRLALAAVLAMGVVDLAYVPAQLVFGFYLW